MDNKEKLNKIKEIVGSSNKETFENVFSIKATLMEKVRELEQNTNRLGFDDVLNLVLAKKAVRDLELLEKYFHIAENSLLELDHIDPIFGKLRQKLLDLRW